MAEGDTTQIIAAMAVSELTSAEQIDTTDLMLISKYTNSDDFNLKN